MEERKIDVTPIDNSTLLAQVSAAYFSHNVVSPNEIANVMATIRRELGFETNAVAPTTREPAVPVKKLVTPEYIVCLEDGKKLKMLKRYLRSRYQLTPEEYRQKWALPADYPMVAPNYAQQRSDFAKKIGLGTASAGKKR